MAGFLVTGGGGFIGSHLVKKLIGLGHEVIVIDNLSSGDTLAAHPMLEFIQGDVSDIDILGQALSRVDYCIHLAAIASVHRCDESYLNTHHHNYLPLIMIFECIRQQKLPVSVIYASSAAVYGQINDIAQLKESLYPQPQSLYGVSKLACESVAYAALQSHSIPSVGLRLFNVYGPGQRVNSDYAGVITLFMNRILQNLPITIYGTGKQTRDFIFIDDVIEAIICAVDNVLNAPGIYNICTNQAISVAKLASTLMQCCDNKVKVNHQSQGQYDILHSLGDRSKAEHFLSFTATTSLRDGLQKTVDESKRALEDKAPLRRKL